MILSYVFLILGSVLAIWGSQTRGTQSNNIAILGGIIWILALIYIFLTVNWQQGLIAILVSFIVGAICQNVFPKKK